MAGGVTSDFRPKLVSKPDGTLRMLVVGARSLPRGMRDDDTVVYVDFADVTAEVLADVRPDLVVSMVLGPGFDVLDLARRLDAVGYSGQYRAVLTGQSYGALIKAEVIEAVPDLDFDIYHPNAP